MIEAAQLLMGLAIFLAGTVGGFLVAWGRVAQWMKSTDGRLGSIDRHLGIDGGEAEFMRRAEAISRFVSIETIVQSLRSDLVLVRQEMQRLHGGE